MAVGPERQVVVGSHAQGSALKIESSVPNMERFILGSAVVIVGILTIVFSRRLSERNAAWNARYFRLIISPRMKNYSRILSIFVGGGFVLFGLLMHFGVLKINGR